MRKRKILVIGDLILDVYHHGTYLGKSVNDDMTTVGFGESDTYTWGGAGFLVRNILALGGHVSFISLIGKDEFAVRANGFTHPRLKKVFLTLPSRPTTVKERFWIGKHKLLSWYRFDNSPLPRNAQDSIMRMFRSELHAVGKVVLTDYRHGLLSPSLAKKIVRECARQKVPLYIDSQIAHSKGNHIWYKGANLFCLNQKEAKSADPRFDVKRLAPSLGHLKKILDTQNIVVKLGERGSAALLGGEYIETKAYHVKTIDSTGAGDAFLGCLATSKNALPTVRDFRKANIWAALSTTMIGTEIFSVEKFRKIMAKL